MKLVDYFNEHLRITDEISENIDRVFRYESVKKGNIVIKHDNLSQKVIFIEKGLMRTFYMKDHKDITHLFFSENMFTAPVESVFFHRTCPYAWETLEHCEIRTTHYHEFESLFSTVPGFEKFFRGLLIQFMDSFSERLHALQFQTAHDRYHKLLEMQPDILLRAPLGHIASYLGITQQTLSVIRSRN